MSELEVYAKVKECRRRGDLECAESVLYDWAAKTGEFRDEWQALLMLYAFATGEGHVDKAVEYASRLVRLDENDPGAHSCLGQAYRLRGELAEAEKAARCAVELAQAIGDINLPVYVTELSDILRRQGRLEECEELALSGLDEKPEKSESVDALRRADQLVLLGRQCREQGQHEKSAKYYRQALRVLSEQDTQEPSAALQYLDRCVVLARLYRQKGDCATSAEYYRKAMRIVSEQQKAVVALDSLQEEMIGVVGEAEEQ